MLTQSPPMQAAGKSHSSMSVGDSKGGGPQGPVPCSLGWSPRSASTHPPSCYAPRESAWSVRALG